MYFWKPTVFDLKKEDLPERFPGRNLIKQAQKYGNIPQICYNEYSAFSNLTKFIRSFNPRFGKYQSLPQGSAYWNVYATRDTVIHESLPCGSAYWNTLQFDILKAVNHSRRGVRIEILKFSQVESDQQKPNHSHRGVRIEIYCMKIVSFSWITPAGECVLKY